MNSWKTRFAVLIVLAGLLAACAAPATEAPTSQPTEPAAPATEPANTVVTESPTETAATEAPATEASAGASISFTSDILPILQSRCINCHGGQRTEEGLSLTSHAGMLMGSENGAVLVPGDGADSLLIQLVSEGKMPKRGPKLTPDQVQLITEWINQGALNN